VNPAPVSPNQADGVRPTLLDEGWSLGLSFIDKLVLVDMLCLDFKPNPEPCLCHNQALVSVLPFFVGWRLGLPFIDKPVLVETLVGAALAAMQDGNEHGVMRFMDMERLAASPLVQ
jgi:hypothetical protein